MLHIHTRIYTNIYIYIYVCIQYVYIYICISQNSVPSSSFLIAYSQWFEKALRSMLTPRASLGPGKVRASRYIYTNIYIYIYVYVHIYTYLHIYIYMLYIYIYVHIFMYIYMYIYIYVHICRYIDTHWHTESCNILAIHLYIHKYKHWYSNTYNHYIYIHFLHYISTILHISYTWIIIYRSDTLVDLYMFLDFCEQTGIDIFSLE